MRDAGDEVVGEVKDFRPMALVRVMLRAIRVPWMWLGISLMAVAFFSLLGALSVENVSFVVPVTALSYARQYAERVTGEEYRIVDMTIGR